MPHAVACVTYSLLFNNFNESNFLELSKKHASERLKNEKLQSELQNIENELSIYLNPKEVKPKQDFKNFNAFRDMWEIWEVKS